MEMTELMAISPLDGRYHDKLTALRPIFSEYGLIRYRTQVEIRWLETLANAHLPNIKPLSANAKSFLDKLIADFSINDALTIKKIEAGINHDVKAVEYFLKTQIVHHPELKGLAELIHLGCTSEDINNLAYGLMLNAGRQLILLPQLNEITAGLRRFAHNYAAMPMLARTHGQPATPTTVGKEFANVIARLERQIQHLSTFNILGKINGATGNYSALRVTFPDINWQEISQAFVTSLDLTFNPYTTQIEPHDTIAEYLAIVERINHILIDFDRDVWGYIALDYFKQKPFAHEVGSSTMPHKINPIDFENAEGNFGIANALCAHMIAKLPISRWQRDLSDSTVLRNMGVIFGHTVLGFQATLKGLTKLEPNEEKMQDELNQHWEVLGEAIQTVMRRYQIDNPYEQLKEFTRGKSVDQALLAQFIDSLSLPENEKTNLKALTPASYLGDAVALAKKI